MPRKKVPLVIPELVNAGLPSQAQYLIGRSFHFCHAEDQRLCGSITGVSITTASGTKRRVVRLEISNTFFGANAIDCIADPHRHSDGSITAVLYLSGPPKGSCGGVLKLLPFL